MFRDMPVSLLCLNLCRYIKIWVSLTNAELVVSLFHIKLLVGHYYLHYWSTQMFRDRTAGLATDLHLPEETHLYSTTPILIMTLFF